MKCCRDLSTIKICSASRPSFCLDSTAAAVDKDMLQPVFNQMREEALADDDESPIALGECVQQWLEEDPQTICWFRTRLDSL